MAWKYPVTSSLPSSPQHPDDPEDTASSPLPLGSFRIEVIDIYTLDDIVSIPYAESQTPSNALAASGYLGTSSVSPSLAISFKTLELFRRLRLRKASFSMEAFAKVVCDYYNVGFILFSLDFVGSHRPRFLTGAGIARHSLTHSTFTS